MWMNRHKKHCHASRKQMNIRNKCGRGPLHGTMLLQSALRQAPCAEFKKSKQRATTLHTSCRSAGAAKGESMVPLLGGRGCTAALAAATALVADTLRCYKRRGQGCACRFVYLLELWYCQQASRAEPAHYTQYVFPLTLSPALLSIQSLPVICLHLDSRAPRPQLSRHARKAVKLTLEDRHVCAVHAHVLHEERDRSTRR